MSKTYYLHNNHTNTLVTAPCGTPIDYPYEYAMRLITWMNERQENTAIMLNMYTIKEREWII